VRHWRLVAWVLLVILLCLSYSLIGKHTRWPEALWLEQNSFAPWWLPEPLRRPLLGYLVAMLLARREQRSTKGITC
jgi:hypothetical protein